MEVICKEEQKLDNLDFAYPKLDPNKNYYRVKDSIKDDAKLTNPFENIEDVYKFAKKLREDSYR